MLQCLAPVTIMLSCVGNLPRSAGEKRSCFSPRDPVEILAPRHRDDKCLNATIFREKCAKNPISTSFFFFFKSAKLCSLSDRNSTELVIYCLYNWYVWIKKQKTRRWTFIYWSNFVSNNYLTDEYDSWITLM